MERLYKVYKGEERILYADAAYVREELEDLIEETLGFFVSLQESEEGGENEDELRICLHTDNEEDMDGGDMLVLEKHGIGVNQGIDECHEAICKLLGITIQ